MFVANGYMAPDVKRRTTVEPEYIGIDLHKAFFQVCVVRANGERQWEQRWPTTDAGIAGLLTRWRPTEPGGGRSLESDLGFRRSRSRRDVGTVAGGRETRREAQIKAG